MNLIKYFLMFFNYGCPLSFFYICIASFIMLNILKSRLWCILVALFLKCLVLLIEFIKYKLNLSLHLEDYAFNCRRTERLASGIKESFFFKSNEICETEIMKKIENMSR